MGSYSTLRCSHSLAQSVRSAGAAAVTRFQRGRARAAQLPRPRSQRDGPDAKRGGDHRGHPAAMAVLDAVRAAASGPATALDAQLEQIDG
jgi:hypothetical protein